MHFNEGEQVCGVDVRVAQRIVRSVDTYGWTSPGVVGADVGMSRAEADDLLQAMHAEGFVAEPHLGPLPASHEGKWLESEEVLGDAILLWHITSTGKALAKAPIGPPLTPAEAETIVEAIVEQCEEINANTESTHVIEKAMLYGSMCSLTCAEVWDVDIAVIARWRQPHGLDQGARVELEASFRQIHERADVVVEDDSWMDGPVISPGIPTRQVFPRT